MGVCKCMGRCIHRAITSLATRTRYLVMAYVTVNAPSALRFFGIKSSLVEKAAAAVQKKDV